MQVMSVLIVILSKSCKIIVGINTSALEFRKCFKVVLATILEKKNSLKSLIIKIKDYKEKFNKP